VKHKYILSTFEVNSSLLFKHNRMINLIHVCSWPFLKTWLASAISFYSNVLKRRTLSEKNAD